MPAVRVPLAVLVSLAILVTGGAAVVLATGHLPPYLPHPESLSPESRREVQAI